MLNIELLRRQPDLVRRSLARRGAADALDGVLELDERRRRNVLEGDQLRARRNESSKAIGALIKGGKSQAAEEQREEVRRVGDRLHELDEELRDVEARLRELALSVPNLPLDNVPEGLDESGNVEVRREGEPRAYPFPLKPHWELAESLGVTDVERGAKLSGSRFYVLGEPGIRLQRALVSWMLDLHRTKHGYREVGLPYLVRREVMVDSGNLPKFSENLYHDEEDDLWLIPTAEVPLTGLHRDEILGPRVLPLKYMAHAPSFRREKAAAGRDVRGIKRVHQFEKVEMYQLVEPEQSDDTLQELVGHAEDVCRGLGIPHRVLELCAGDIGFQSAKSYDVELWAPASEEWLEVSSCSNCTDFQARRANIRFRRELTSRLEYVHTLNGSGLALPRVIIAILENYQRADGSVEVPEVLRPYLGEEVFKPVE